MTPYLVVPALAAERRNTLLAEAKAARLAAQARRHVPQTATAANRRSPLRRVLAPLSETAR